MSSSAVKRNGLGLAGAVALGLVFSPAVASKPAQASLQSTPSVSQEIDLSPKFGQSYLKAIFDREPVQNPYFNPKRIIEQSVPGGNMAAAALPVGHGQGTRTMGCRM